MKVNLSPEMLTRIQKYVDDGRFKSIDEFIEQALELLLYAEDNKEEFEKILSA